MRPVATLGTGQSALTACSVILLVILLIIMIWLVNSITDIQHSLKEHHSHSERHHLGKREAPALDLLRNHLDT